ncbi:hypothetical protein B0I35DRAFT_436158 [Stachybotrys elegans]|uniref:D-xylose 1-dehydrogenase (NADP(+), D-xylono-1,5-lactone-forming) n=1 Tax=Stachybotrys elegans TaxID=80388 RepID=A0A8K0WPM1_9HYPO|nr:hypothetical protein B0I35DRAFT_436158 [Stachybotrys elegans]
MSDTQYVAKWGIMATGGIAETFAKDLLTNPAIRGVTDVRHEIVAVGASRSSDKATDFIKRIKGPASAKCYGSYAELVNDPNVDIVYVATPHSHHFQNTMLALEAGKHVLCEKSFTVTASQTKKLVETARLKGLFLMEAVWTRFFPSSIEIRDLISSGAIGNIHRVTGDFSFNINDETGNLALDDSHRLASSELAGGALLDLGIYPITWVFQTLYHLWSDGDKEKPRVIAAINQHHTGVDEMTSIILQFPLHKAMGIALTTFRVATDPDGKGTSGPVVRIQGSLGEIQVFGCAPKPSKYNLLKKGNEPKEFECVYPKDAERDNWGHGMYWEADECVRCLRDGKLESQTMSLEESIVIMETMEEVLKQGGVEYPEAIKTDVYDPKSSLNAGGR